MCVCVCERKREQGGEGKRERERERERQTDRQIDRQTDRDKQTDRQTENAMAAIATPTKCEYINNTNICRENDKCMNNVLTNRYTVVPLLKDPSHKRPPPVTDHYYLAWMHLPYIL